MKFNVFFCWQSETDEQGFDNTTLIRNRIVSIFDSLKDQIPDFDYELFERDDGIPKEFAKQTFDKIALCDIFIADFSITTPPSTEKTCYRREPNANVLSEFSFALRNSYVVGYGSNFENQIVLVCNAINGSPKQDNSLIPADYRGRYFPIEFTTDDNGDIKNESEFYKAFRNSLIQAVDNAKKNFSNKFKPFISWREQSKDADCTEEYFWSERIYELKNIVLENDGILKIVGLSGIGKTRFIFECFRDSGLSDLYLYYDCSEDDEINIAAQVSKVFQEYENGIVVLDNCAPELLDKVVNVRRKKNAKNSVIVLSNDLEVGCPVEVKEIRLDAGYFDVVEKMLARYKDVLPQDQCSQIIQYSDGLPMMAQLLIRGIENGKELGDVGGEYLLTKLLRIENGESNTFLQSLSLFSYLGYEKDMRCEFEFVAKTKDITSLNMSSDEILLNAFEEVVEKYKRKKIIEKKGRMIGIRPMPLAFYLASEWLEKCNSDRMLRVIKAIQDTPFCNRLIAAFGERFRYMGFSLKAQEMLSKILSYNSPFANAELMNTKLGSHLFRVFVEVNPNAVSALLTRVLGGLSQKELLKFIEGRRNIIWTLEKLCFNESTFYDGASMMLQFANAENEPYSNNATGEFIRLFHVYLPATSASLSARLKFLKEKIGNSQNKSVIIQALLGALSLNRAMYLCGAERFGVKQLANYQPDDSEKNEYVDGVINLLYCETKSKTIFSRRAENALIESIAPLCRFGFARNIYACIEKLSSERKYDWDELLDKLTSVMGYIYPKLDELEKKKFDDLKMKLTKNDFFSRYIRISKDAFSRHIEMSYEKVVEIQKKEYESLAKDIIQSKSIDRAFLEEIMSIKGINSYPFGKTLEEGLDEEQKKCFVCDGIEIINNNNDVDTFVLLEFISTLNEDLFIQLLPKLKNLEKKDLLFAVAGRRNIPVDNDFFSYLVTSVRDGKAEVSSFVTYWNACPISIWTDNDIAAFIKLVSGFDNSFASFIKICNVLVLFMKIENYPSCIDVITKNIISNFKTLFVLDVDFCWNVIFAILEKKRDEDFAKLVHVHILQYMNQCGKTRINEIGLSKIYEILFKLYFDVIWSDLSEILLLENEFPVVNQTIEHIVGCPFAESNIVPIISLSIEKNKEYFIKWCQDFPDNAPLRLVGLVPLLKQNGFQKRFYDIIEFIINEFGENEKILNKISLKLNSFAWVGSVIPLYEERISILKEFLNHQKESVKLWAREQIAFYEYKIDFAKEREEEGF